MAELSKDKDTGKKLSRVTEKIKDVFRALIKSPPGPEPGDG